MLRAGDILDLGPLGAKFFIKKTAHDTEGRSFEMEWQLAPNTGGTPVHVHPQATETYEVLEGNFDVYVDGTWRTLSPGERLAVAPGAPHTFRNAGGGVVRVYNTHQPAMRFDQYFEGLSRIANSGIISGKRMTFRAIVHLAMLMTSHQEEIVSIKPPHLVMRILAAIGRSLGYRI
jgi:mannose-6-phosphate isomerase-like protein (cupin superfamily)